MPASATKNSVVRSGSMPCSAGLGPLLEPVEGLCGDVLRGALDEEPRHREPRIHLELVRHGGAAVVVDVERVGAGDELHVATGPTGPLHTVRGVVLVVE